MASIPALRLVAALFVAQALAAAHGMAAANSYAAGIRDLRAELPPKTTIARADCEVLAAAMGRAIHDHAADAPGVLYAALTGGGERDFKDFKDTSPDRPCACVVHLTRAAITAAPDQASALIELAASLDPNCADALTAAAVDPDPLFANGGGGGLGPGSPGAPGFMGSPPSSGRNALPTPEPVTPVQNE